MDKQIPSEWLYPSSLEQAAATQRELAERLILHDDFSSSAWIGGMDVSNNLYDPQALVYASAIVLNQHSLALEEQAAVAQVQKFPYVPGFLGFREAPALVAAFNKLRTQPFLFMVDGHGISHPRRLGIASHLGVLLDIPTIGVAKTILVGQPASDLGEAVGDRVPLVWKKQTIGMVVRTKTRCRPLLISAGHRISLESAVELVLSCVTRYRLPETTRHAHLAANACRKEPKQFEE